MKFTKEDYKNLLDCIETAGIDLTATRAHYVSSKIGNEPEKRFIWDVFWASKYSKIFRSDSNKYLDNHIETATKRAINELIELENRNVATKH